MTRGLTDTYHALEERYPLPAKAGRFIVAGSTGAAIDLAFLYLFTSVLGVWYLVSAVLAFVIAFSASFVMQKFWTFRDRRRAGLHVQVSKYFILATINLGVNTLIVYGCVAYFNLHYLIAQIIASALVALESFGLYHLIFEEAAPADPVW